MPGPATEPPFERTSSWSFVALATAIAALGTGALIVVIPPRGQPLALLFVSIVILPAYAWWLDRSAPRAPVSLGRATPVDGIAPVALLIPLRRVRPYAWALIATAIAVVSFITAAGGRSPALMTLFGYGAIVFAVIQAISRRRLGFEFTTEGLRSIGVMRDLFFPWAAIHEVAAIPGPTRRSLMLLGVDGIQVRRRRYLGVLTLPWRPLAEHRVGVSGLPIPEEALIELVERFRAHPDERAQLVGPAGVRAATQMKTVPLFGDGESDGRWLRRILRKSVAAYPLGVVACYVFLLILQALGWARGLVTVGMALIMGAFITPFFFVPSQYRFVQELGCRRSILFWIVPIGLGVLALGLAVFADAVGFPLF